MGGPVTLEDQGSFFVGGVTKVSEYAAVPGAPPGQPPPPRTPQQITIGQMYVQFQIPARSRRAGLARDHGARLDAHGRRARIDAGRPRRLVSVLRAQGRRDLRRRSVRPRPLGLRSVGAARSRGAAAGRQPRRRRRAAADVAAHHRQRRVPGLVRPSAAGRLDDRHGPADPARLGRRSARHEHGRRNRTWRRCFRSRPSPSTTSSSCRTPRRRCPARRARPACRKRSAPANTWTPQNLATLVERLGGAIVATHSQSGIMGHHMIRILKERGHAGSREGLDHRSRAAARCRRAASRPPTSTRFRISRSRATTRRRARSARKPSTPSTRAARKAKAPRKAEYMKLDELRHARRHAHDDARREQPRDRRPHARMGRRATCRARRAAERGLTRHATSADHAALLRRARPRPIPALLLRDPQDRRSPTSACRWPRTSRRGARSATIGRAPGRSTSCPCCTGATGSSPRR